jgi:hypothetical protein
MSAAQAAGDPEWQAITAQVRALRAAGHRVVILGPGARRVSGCRRIGVRDPRSAAIVAVALQADLVITHSSPFYSAVRWLGAYAPVIACDSGDDATEREAQAEKMRALAMSDQVISYAAAADRVTLLAEVDRLLARR